MGIFEGKNEITNSIWCERYRPCSLDEYIGNEHLKERVQTYLDTNDIPHLLFFGNAGGGKTTLAKLIVNTIECDYIIINASDENNVETVRTKVKDFASTTGYEDIKIAVLDEFDFMSINGQSILRNLMETFSEHCRFILTCNYIDKVIDPIQSRCQKFQIIPPSKMDVEVHVGNILQLEKVKFEQDVLKTIVDSYYPDIRKIINSCQGHSSKGELTLNIGNIVESDIKGKIVDILKSDDDKRNKYVKARKAIANARVQNFSELYTHLYETVEDYSNQNPMAVINLISEGQYKDALVADKEIVFISTLIQIINII